MMPARHWMGATSSTVPVMVSIVGFDEREVAADVKAFETAYPVADHGTNPGPVVNAVTGQFRCSIALIPSKKGSIKLWGMLKQQ